MSPAYSLQRLGYASTYLRLRAYCEILKRRHVERLAKHSVSSFFTGAVFLLIPHQTKQVADQPSPEKGTIGGAFFNGLRSVGPLLLFLVVLIKGWLRQPLPIVYATTVAPDEKDFDNSLEATIAPNPSLRTSTVIDTIETVRERRARIPTLFWCFICYVGLSLYNYGE